MKTRLSIKFKAVLLTILFLLNTIVGFACAVVTNMGFNKGHHDEHSSVVKSKPHAHPLGTKPHSHQHTDAKAPISPHHENEQKDKKDNCCKDEVAKFVSLDKQMVKNTVVKIPLLLLEVVIPVYQNSDILVSGVHTPDNSYFVRCHHPPIPDIRIAVQSFQI